MCNKPFDSLICNIAFFLAALAGLITTSGIALRLGGLLMSEQEPQNTEYSFYASESGFFIGAKSAAFFQWMTAGFVTLFAKLNAANTDKQLGDRMTIVYLQNFLLLTVFGASHYFSLPMSAQDEAKCMDLKEQLIELKGSRTQNPLCKGDHTWDNLFMAFSVGVSVCFAGCLLLQTIYLCLRAACEIQTTPNIEPAPEVPPVVVAGPAPTVTLTEMMSTPTHGIDLRPRA